MPEYSFALYNAFSETTFGGSAAGIIADAQDLETQQMQRIAKEIGAPATCFITAIDDRGVDVRFFSTRSEYSMCGHGTIAMMTWLIERGLFQLKPHETRLVELRTSVASANVEINARDDGRVQVMLPLSVASFEPCSVVAVELAALFGIDGDSFETGLPFELTRSDFTHLIVALGDLVTMQKLKPDFAAITRICHRLQLDTIALFTRETINRESTIHCREFCPAVGTPEAPASGTTNRALACYLLRHGLIEAKTNGLRSIIAEQGYEIDRPSRICTELMVEDGQAVNIKVGGLATKTMEGKFIVN